MLMAHPDVLRDLVDRYTALQALAGSGRTGPELRRRLEDTVYTLCVSTGTRTVDRALAEARRRLASVPGAAAGPVPDSLSGTVSAG
ncbi:DUF5133 domain-containing protein [Streptomyces sp. F63]|uniref:DUF5133 domain-containing protein n=1 Tax=Streptomyces sp. F63 TaxID=2824887 RepID=UPI001B3831ED|nr:DUF5133 domain-containing protein [Streptomyces sp. F63]MBQ0985789.1 DUF5133 domain-containing protein [Streptomyces sp. F63]